MKALSIRQPWAWLIAEGHKKIENRPWATSFRGRIYIHASKHFDNGALVWLRDKGLAPTKDFELFSHELPRGGIIGEVNIVNCVTSALSPWFIGPYGFVLANPVKYKFLIPCKGRLRFFQPEIDNIRIQVAD
jgi:hypothetical protein